MKATFIIELNEKHRNAMNNSQLLFEDVDISIIPSIGWRYEYIDNDKSYYGKVIAMEIYKNSSKNEEELYITIEEN
jgi:hypothetical protein